MNKISARQIYLFLACVAPVGKLILLPAHLVQTAKNDLLFPALVSFAVQAGVVFCVLLLSRRNESLYSLLENTLGRIAAKILMCILALFLLYASLMPLLEQKFFVQSVFYDTLPSLVAFIPFFVFSVYVCAKPLVAFGRTWDILAPIAIVGLLGIFILSVGSADYGALLPIGAAGGEGFLKGTTSIVAWFYDAAILLLLMGKFEYKKGMAWKGLLAYLAGAAAILFFLATFYAIFGEYAVNQPFAFTKTTRYFPAIDVLGRIDYIFIFALSLVMAFWCTLPIQASIDCCVQAFGRHEYLTAILSASLNAILLALTIILDYRFGDVLKTVSGTVFWIFPVFAILLPLLALLLLIRRPRRAVS